MQISSELNTMTQLRPLHIKTELLKDQKITNDIDTTTTTTNCDHSSPLMIDISSAPESPLSTPATTLKTTDDIIELEATNRRKQKIDDDGNDAITSLGEQVTTTTTTTTKILINNYKNDDDDYNYAHNLFLKHKKHKRQCTTKSSDAIKSSETNLAIANQLIEIIRCGNFQQLIQLLHKTKPDLNLFVDGQTVLHYSLLFGRDLAWCKELISHGADPNLVNIDGWHPIHLAAFRGLSDTICYLVKCSSKCKSYNNQLD